MRKQKNPSIRQVAKEAGVSIYTVSSVLNNKGDISPKTRDIVLAAIKKLDYDPLRNIPLARKAQRTTFGVVLPDIAAPSDTFYYRSIMTAGEVGRDLGFEVKIFLQRDFQAAELGFAPERTRYGCSAFLFFMPGSGWEETVRDLRENGVRTAVVGRRYTEPGVFSAVVSRHAVLTTAMQHLAACGCRAVGLNTFTRHLPGKDAFLDRYRQLVRELGLVVDERLIADRAANKGGDPSLPFIALLKDGVPLDGILFTADRFAARAIRGLWEAGIRVPDDVMIMGINDDPIAADIIPSITTVRIPVEEMVTDACRFLYDYKKKDASKGHFHEFDHSLVARESTVPNK